MTPGQILCEQLLVLLEYFPEGFFGDNLFLARLFLAEEELIATVIQEMVETALIERDLAEFPISVQHSSQDEILSGIEGISLKKEEEEKESVQRKRRIRKTRCTQTIRNLEFNRKDVFSQSLYSTPIVLLRSNSAIVVQSKAFENPSFCLAKGQTKPTGKEGQEGWENLKNLKNTSTEDYSEPTPAKEEKIIIPGSIREIFELWNSLSFPKCRIRHTKTFRETLQKIVKAKQGELLLSDPTLLKYNRKFTLEEIKNSILNFYLAATNDDYEPPVWVKVGFYSKTSLSTFLYNPITPELSRRSLFITYLNKPTLCFKYKDLPTEDKHPQVSSVLRSFYKEKILGGTRRELTDVEEGKIRKGAERTVDFFRVNKSKFSNTVLMGGVTAVKLARWVVEAINISNRNGDEKVPLQIGFLCSDHTFGVRLPQYLLQQGIWEETEN